MRYDDAFRAPSSTFQRTHVERFVRLRVVGKGSLTMASITEIAEKFFVACEAGKGWQGCQAYCHPDATFSAQAGALAGVETLEQYSEWMKGLFTPVPDGR